VGNAIRHADATEIAIILTFDPNEVSLVIRDDGMGFDASDTRQRGHSYGLRSMRDRATAVKGNFTVISQPSQGTTVQILLRIP
jgi:two-component system, NarL family, sensor histidine kinase DegS